MVSTDDQMANDLAAILCDHGSTKALMVEVTSFGCRRSHQRDPHPGRCPPTSGPQLLAEVLVDVSTGTDSKNEHHKSIVFDVVDHPVSADADATPAE